MKRSITVITTSKLDLVICQNAMTRPSIVAVEQ